ncbi:MAG: hypothetical protein WA446_07255 [Steroidobacteraceae bacterium]
MMLGASLDLHSTCTQGSLTGTPISQGVNSLRHFIKQVTLFLHDFFLTLSSSFTRSLDAARCLGVKSAISSLSCDAWTRYSHLASSRNTVNARFNRTFVLAVDLPNALAEPCFRHRNDFVDHQLRSTF